MGGLCPTNYDDSFESETKQMLYIVLELMKKHKRNSKQMKFCIDFIDLYNSYDDED